MKPWIQLATAKTSGGDVLTLHRRDTTFVIRVNGAELMSNRMYASEERLAELACAHLAEATRPRVLIGGLGMGFTLAAALRVLPRRATVCVAELVPEIVEWNRGPLAEINGAALQDGRVEVEVNDVGAVIKRDAGRYDAIMLDVDNGPQALTSKGNDKLYTPAGLLRSARALTERGTYALWSASSQQGFTRRLQEAGFEAKHHYVFAHGDGGPKHSIWLATPTREPMRESSREPMARKPAARGKRTFK